MAHASRVLSLSRGRHAVRRFLDQPVSGQLIACVLDCARFAPSAREAQPWRFVVVQDALTRRRLAAAAFNHPHARTAPVLILCCARIHSHVSGNGRPSHPVDVAAAAQSMVLAAADMGLAASWLTGFREPAVRELTGVPDDVPIVAILAIGYPDAFEPIPERRPSEEVVVWERWGEERPEGWG